MNKLKSMTVIFKLLYLRETLIIIITFLLPILSYLLLLNKKLYILYELEKIIVQSELKKKRYNRHYSGTVYDKIIPKIYFN